MVFGTEWNGLQKVLRKQIYLTTKAAIKVCETDRTKTLILDYAIPKSLKIFQNYSDVSQDKRKRFR